MKIVRVLCGFAAIAALSVVVGAQARPDFSGRWVQVSPETGAGTEQVVKHEGGMLSTMHDSEGGGHGLVYTLDGTEQRSTLPSHGSEIVTVSRASWNGDALVITSTSTYPDGRELKGKQTWTLGDDGRLTIKLEQSMAGQPNQITLVFTRGSAVTQTQQAPERRSLDFLTVPDAQLPAGCLVAPPEPVPTVDPSADVSADPGTGGINVVAEAPRVVATGVGAFPNISWSGVANPWMGTDRRRVSAIRASTSGGADGTKDIQFLDRKEAVALQNRWADGVVDGYRARYSFNGQFITVLALRFENEALAQQDQPVTVAPLRPSRPGSARIEIGPVVVRVQSPDDNACAVAVREHLSGLIQSRDNR